MDMEDTVVLTDEEGNEHEFAVLDMLEVGDSQYAILLPIGEDAGDEDEAIILKVETDDQGEEVLVEIEDDEEWDAVARAWEESVYDEEEEQE